MGISSVTKLGDINRNSLHRHENTQVGVSPPNIAEVGGGVSAEAGKGENRGQI